MGPLVILVPGQCDRLSCTRFCLLGYCSNMCGFVAAGFRMVQYIFGKKILGFEIRQDTDVSSLSGIDSLGLIRCDCCSSSHPCFFCFDFKKLCWKIE